MNNDLFADKFSEAFSEALSKQPAIVRRKNTINGITGLILHLAGYAAAFLTDVPLWGAALFSLVVGVVQVFHSATSEGPLTPSQEKKIVAEIKKVKTPEFEEANVLGTLLNIFDAVNNQRQKERGVAGYGLGAANEAVEGPESDELDYVPQHEFKDADVPSGTPLATFQSLTREQ